MRRYLPVVILAATVIPAVSWWPHVRDEFFVLVGNRDEGGGYYGAWSGFFGGLQVFEWAVLGALIWWHHQCGVHRCYWYARRTTAAGERACWKHHPHPRRTVEDMRAAHHAALKARFGK